MQFESRAEKLPPRCDMTKVSALLENNDLADPEVRDGDWPTAEVGASKKASYWNRRSDMLYYQYFRYMIRCIGPEAGSIVDVGSHSSPYLEWFDWIPEKVSVDLKKPYQSETVRGVEGNVLDLAFPKTFDIATCLQVLEHVPEPAPFARRLLELGRLVLVSVPYKWPAGRLKAHVNDPVDRRRLAEWFGRKPNYTLIVHEPFVKTSGARVFALYDTGDPGRRFGLEVRKGRRPA